MRKWLLIACSACLVPFAQGVPVYSIPFTVTDASGGSATALFTLTQTGLTYQLQIDVTDTTVSPNTVAENVSAIQFTAGAAGTLDTSASGNLVCINDPGCVPGPLSTSAAIGWVFSTPSTGTYLLDDLVGTGHSGPSHTLIGTAPYSGGSIVGNGPHNPFLDGTTTWFIDGLTSPTVVSGVLFQFGTTDCFGAGSTTCGDGGIPGSSTPEPISFVLVGSGLGALFVLRRRYC
jgi:hypothetical protein